MQFTPSFVAAAAVFLTSTVSAGSTSLVKYSGIGYSGSYKDITNMDESSGTCSSSSKSFSGNLSPLDEDLSVHIRGPINLKKFAVYTASSSSKKKRDTADCDEQINLKRNLHHNHKREAATYTVDVTETVFVTAGEDETTTLESVASSSAPAPVSVSSEYSAPASSAPASSAAPASSSASLTLSVANKVIDQYHSTDVNSGTPSSHSASSTASSASSEPTSISGDWNRDSYYDASSGSADNVVFMNHKGDSSFSGTWSSTFGNSISYADASGTGKSKSSVVLDDTTLDSDKEVILFSSESCDDSCGYYRENIPAKKGWSGDRKIFAFNFKMPTATDSETNNHDMPAVWLLNGRIPRTLQYGDESCSCWSTGCGELDLWEVITEGSDQLINHIHDGQGQDGTRWGGGGADDYFTRPTSDYVTLVAILDGSSIHLAEVDDFDFESSLDSDTVSGWISGTASAANLV